MGKTQTDVAWGVEFGGSAVRLVRVSRVGAGYRADRYAEAGLEERWQAPPGAADAAGRLAAEAIARPLGACLPDELVLFRALSLPEAPREVLDKMVRGQLEVLIPTQAQRFVSGYHGSADPYVSGRQRVLVCAARRDALTGPLAACSRLGRGADAVTPSVLALAAMWARLDAGGGGSVVLLDVGARCTALAVVDDAERRVVECGVIDQGGDHWTERLAAECKTTCRQAETRKLQYASTSGAPAPTQPDPAVRDALQSALRDWARQLREAYEHCVAGIPRQRRPVRCVLFGRSSRMPGVAALVGETLGLAVQPAAAPAGLSLAGGIDFLVAAPAIGAAMSVMEPGGQAVNLAPSARGAPRGRRTVPWRWAALTGWLLAAVAALYVLDRVEAGKLGKALRDARAKTSMRGDLDRRLAIGRYLEMAGPTPLEVLDRLSQAVPKGGLLSTWRYSRAGDVAVAGTVPNDKALLEMLGKLRDVGEVDWKSGRPDKNKFRFEVQLRLRRSMAPVSTSPAAGPATRPATGPASRPATVPATSPGGETRPATPPATRSEGGAS